MCMMYATVGYFGHGVDGPCDGIEYQDEVVEEPIERSRPPHHRNSVTRNVEICQNTILGLAVSKKKIDHAVTGV